MSFAIYMIRFVILIAGLGYAAYLAHIPGQWIFAGLVVLAAVSLLSAVKAARQRHPIT